MQIHYTDILQHIQSYLLQSQEEICLHVPQTGHTPLIQILKQKEQEKIHIHCIIEENTPPLPVSNVYTLPQIHVYHR